MLVGYPQPIKLPYMGNSKDYKPTRKPTKKDWFVALGIMFIAWAIPMTIFLIVMFLTN